MSNWTNIKFTIRRHPDRQLLRALGSAFRAVAVSVDSVQVRWLGNNEVIQIPPNKLQGSEGLQEWSDETSLLKFAQAGFLGRASVSVTRGDTDTFDAVSLHLEGLSAHHPTLPSPTPQAIATLVHSLKTHLVEMTHGEHLNLFGADIKRHLDERETSLAKLEGILARTTHEFTEGAAAVRAAEDEHLRTQQAKLRSDLDEQRALLDAEYQKKHEVIAAREQALEQRLTEVDAQGARHARRKIREDLKKELANRANKFELTAGTQGLREPIRWLVLSLLFILLTAFLAAAGYALVQKLSDPWTTVRVATLGVAFASTLVFYLRWQNRWFEQHAQEEFRLKRMTLDVDRASWVVEMAMEWKDEKGEGLPEELLNRLSAHLFEQGATRDEALHPADQLASALLGSAASLSVDMPGTNGSLKFDRKGLQELRSRSGQG